MGYRQDYKWSQGFYGSPFGDGDVPQFAVLDAQIRYRYKDWNSMFKIGSSNLLNNRHIEAFGGPTVDFFIFHGPMTL